jgi:hypothetical protein
MKIAFEKSALAAQVEYSSVQPLSGRNTGNCNRGRAE